MTPTDRPDARSRVLEVARRRFVAGGSPPATLDEIRREAGVSVGALYHHFPDRAALAAAVYARVAAEYQSGFLRGLRSHGTAKGGIHGGVEYHLRWVGAYRGEAVLLLGDRLDSVELRDADRAFLAAIADWWRPHQNYRVLLPLQPGITAALWLGPAHEFSRYWIAGGEPRMPRGAVKVLADAAWAVLRAS